MFIFCKLHWFFHRNLYRLDILPTGMDVLISPPLVQSEIQDEVVKRVVFLMEADNTAIKKLSRRKVPLASKPLDRGE